MNDGELEGGCLCGALRFRVSGPETSVCYCHCRSCRLAVGAPFVAWMTLPASGFSLTRGELALCRSSQKVSRGFCASCGTSLTYAHEDRPDEIDVTLATLDEPGSLRPAWHIWTSDKPAWVVLADDLPQFTEWRRNSD
ncbi:MAG: GFA family protein [Gammaproteobacteria bacterium]